jgi:hypothetical protein
MRFRFSRKKGSKGGQSELYREDFSNINVLWQIKIVERKGAPGASGVLYDARKTPVQTERR